MMFYNQIWHFSKILYFQQTNHDFPRFQIIGNVSLSFVLSWSQRLSICGNPIAENKPIVSTIFFKYYTLTQRFELWKHNSSERHLPWIKCMASKSLLLLPPPWFDKFFSEREILYTHQGITTHKQFAITFFSSSINKNANG